MPYVVSAGEEVIFVGISSCAICLLIQQGRIQFNDEVNLTQADIPASNGYIHNIHGILLPEALRPVLPHRCDLVTYRAVRVSSGLCLAITVIVIVNCLHHAPSRIQTSWT